MQTLADFWELAGPLIEPPAEYQEKAWRQWGGSEHLVRIRAVLASRAGAVRRRSRSSPPCAPLVDELGVKPKDIFQPIRVALTGTTVSPGIFESVAALGRDETPLTDR